MEPRKRIRYVLDESARRVLEISKAHGDEVADCLRPEFLGIKKKPDGNHEFPRGLRAAIQLVHRANNNGKASEPAAQTINGMVDLVAERICGVKS